MCWGCGLDITKESYGHFSKCSLSDMHEEIIDAGNIYNDGGVNYVIRPFARAHQKNPVILFLLALLSWRLKFHNFSDQNFFGLSVVGIWLPVHHPLDFHLVWIKGQVAFSSRKLGEKVKRLWYVQISKEINIQEKKIYVCLNKEPKVKKVP